MKKTKLFLPIRKVDEEQRLVYGVITEETMDKAGEVLDYEGSKPLFEKWSNGIATATEGKSYGNVRVMHTNKVAGILHSELVFDDDAKTVEACAKVIDDAEWELVKAGAYTGFSIGGRYVKRWKDGDVTKFIAEPVEVSLVDNPCVPTATFALVKADGTEVDQEFQLWQPTNDEVAAEATNLAKAAGGNWTDFLDEARDKLVKAHADEKSDDEESEEEKEDEEDEDDKSAKSNDADDSEADDKKKDKSDDEDADKAASEDDDEAAKADVAEPAQVWQTADGQTFEKKADANAHHAALVAQAAADPLSKALGSLRTAVHGDNADTAADDETRASIIETGTEVTKWHGVLTAARTSLDAHVVNKGLYQVSRLADLLESLGYVCSSSCWERESEKDNSPVPEMLAEGLVQLGVALVTMAQEEVAEMIMEMQERGLDVDTIISTLPEKVELSAGIEMVKTTQADLMKAGSRHSAGDKSKLKEIKRLLKELGVEDDDDEDKVAEKLAKFTNVETENVALRKTIADAVPAIEQLQKDVEALKAAPMPPARTTVVSKGQELNGTDPETVKSPATLEELVKVHGAENLALAAIKLSQKQGHQMIGRGSIPGG